MNPTRQAGGEDVAPLSGVRQVRRACLAGFLFLVLLPGCAAHRPALPRVSPIPNAARLLHILSARGAGLRDLEARARLNLHIEGVRKSAAAILRYRAPDSLKLDVSGTLGVGLFHALARRDSLALYLPRTNQYLNGPAEQTFYRVTGVDLSFYDLRRVILGLPGLSPLDLPRVSVFETRGDTIFVEILAPLWTHRITFDRHTVTLLEERIYTPGGALLSRRVHSDYREENGVVLPRRIEIIQGDDRIGIEITRRKVNAGLKGAPFNLQVPADAIHVDEAPEP